MCSWSCLPHIIVPSLLELLLYQIPQYEQNSEIIYTCYLPHEFSNTKYTPKMGKDIFLHRNYSYSVECDVINKCQTRHRKLERIYITI